MIRIISANDVCPTDLRPELGAGRDISQTVSDIITNVRANGDAALHEYSREFDGVTELKSLEVTHEEWDAAVAAVEPDFMHILERAARNIETYHRNQVRSGYVSHGTDGAVMGQRIIPLERVGIYIPGGTAAYPSSALMNAIPAKIAGVSEIIMVTPPGADGGIKNNYILAAARVAGVDRVFKLGGAQAVAALAYGTQSVPRVDKILGPGNAFVSEAKRQVFGAVGIDMTAGPSDVLILGDATTNPVFAAADMLAQAEHDVNARAVLITTSSELATAVAQELEAQLAQLPRREIATQSIENNGLIIVADTLDQAIDFANEVAPEHLEICTDTPFDYLERIKNAASVFLGKHTPEALCDYMAGPNHTLPTYGAARFASPLSVDDFVKKSSFTYFGEAAFRALADDVVSFAQHEMLDAHARSVSKRLDERGGK